jgi:hypothetical protein
MKNGTPGTITVTIVADHAGDKYNVASVSRFTLPGLKGGDMYDKVYARSTSAFAGGFSGEEPSVSADAKRAATAELQGRLKNKVTERISTLSTGDSVVFPSMAVVSFQELPPSNAAESKVNVNVRAKVEIPVLPSKTLNKTIAETVSADAENASISLIPKQDFGATIVGTSTSYSSTPLNFALTGSAQLIWDIDSSALASALVGKDQTAFQNIVNGFPGVQEARARIEPFWTHTFPTDPQKIKVVVGDPMETTNP